MVSGFPSVNLKQRAPAGRQSASTLRFGHTVHNTALRCTARKVTLNSLRYWHGREKRRHRQLGQPSVVSHDRQDDHKQSKHTASGMLSDVLSSANLLHRRHPVVWDCPPDDDLIDRLHSYYTTTLLLCSSLLISAKMFGGRPLECWVPAEYTKSWEDYSGAVG